MVVYIRYNDTTKLITEVSANDDIQAVSGETKDYVEDVDIVLYNKDAFMYDSGSAPASIIQIPNQPYQPPPATSYYFIVTDSTGYIVLASDEDNITPGAGESKVTSENIAPYLAPFAWYWNGSDFDEKDIYPYEIFSDADESVLNKSFLSINYKTELKDGIAYTPEFIIKTSGPDAGCLDKTIYYRGYVDEQNKGTKVLEVQESYTIDESNPSEPNSAKDCISRTKTWKHYNTNGDLVNSETKTRPKLYNTLAKKNAEGKRRRENILLQMTGNVVLAGVLSGTFTDEADGVQKIIDLQEQFEAQLSSWKASGIGSIYDDLGIAVLPAWILGTVANNPYTQAACPWMIGMTYKDYMIDKLKGNID